MGFPPISPRPNAWYFKVLNYEVVDPSGFEPEIEDSKSSVLPLHYESMLGDMGDSNPSPTDSQSVMLPLHQNHHL